MAAMTAVSAGGVAVAAVSDGVAPVAAAVAAPDDTGNIGNDNDGDCNGIENCDTIDNSRGDTTIVELPDPIGNNPKVAISGSVDPLNVDLDDEFVRIAGLPLPSGSYAITALVKSQRQGDFQLVQCELRAGDNTDEGISSFSVEAAERLPLELVHTFSSADEATVFCRTRTPLSPAFGFGGWYPDHCGRGRRDADGSAHVVTWVP